MADLYGAHNARPSSSSSSLESEDMSSFLRDLFSGSSAKSRNAHSQPFASQPVAAVAAGFPDADHRFPDLSCFLSSEANQMSFPPRNDVAGLDFGCQVDKLSEGQHNQIPRRSSKRTRAAEIHNLSEKRRRSRINEKLKALQTLVPNSNKTDKASMLDEAIEYLKQLQLRVQTLAMRSGLGLQPLQTQEHAMQKGMSYDDGYNLENPSALPPNQGFSIQREFDISNHCTMPPFTNIVKPPDAFFGFEPPTTEHEYGFINHSSSTPVKDVYRVNRPSKLPTDSPFSGKHPSAGVSL